MFHSNIPLILNNIKVNSMNMMCRAQNVNIRKWKGKEKKAMKN